MEAKEQITKPDYKSEIAFAVKNNFDKDYLASVLLDYHENDIMDSLAELSEAERKKIYGCLNENFLAGIFEYAEENQGARCLSEMQIQKAAKVVELMESDIALKILNAMENEKRFALIQCMDEDSRKNLRLLSSFDESEIGSRMTANYVFAGENFSVKQAMTSLISQAAENDNISTIFVVDAENKFKGAVDLQKLIIARQDTDFSSLVVNSYPFVFCHERIDQCIERLKDYSEDLIPVLDEKMRLLGVLTSQSLIQVVDDEMAEDYAKLAGLSAEEDLHESVFVSMKKRLPWLFVLLGLGTAVSSVVGIFEQVISRLSIIICFQSLILDMAGNVGTQSLAVTIRILMDESLTCRQKIAFVFKETKIGFAAGLLLGAAAFFVLAAYLFAAKGKSLFFSGAISFCVGFSLFVAMIISSAVGTLIPIFFKRIKIDPAVASGPLITTVNDLVAVVTYYGLSWLFLVKGLGM